MWYGSCLPLFYLWRNSIRRRKEGRKEGQPLFLVRDLLLGKPSELPTLHIPSLVCWLSSALVFCSVKQKDALLCITLHKSQITGEGQGAFSMHEQFSEITFQRIICSFTQTVERCLCALCYSLKEKNNNQKGQISCRTLATRGHLKDTRSMGKRPPMDNRRQCILCDLLS